MDQQDSQETQNKELTKKFLMEEIVRLERIKRSLDRHIRVVESGAFKESDNIDIMNDIQEYTEIRDRCEEMLKISDEENVTTTAEVQVKHDILPENGGSITEKADGDSINDQYNEIEDKLTEMLKISDGDNMTTIAQVHVTHNILPENVGNITETSDVDSINDFYQFNEMEDKSAEILETSDEDNMMTTAQVHVEHNILPENVGNITETSDVDSVNDLHQFDEMEDKSAEILTTSDEDHVATNTQLDVSK